MKEGWKYPSRHRSLLLCHREAFGLLLYNINRRPNTPLTVVREPLWSSKLLVLSSSEAPSSPSPYRPGSPCLSLLSPRNLRVAGSGAWQSGSLSAFHVFGFGSSRPCEVPSLGWSTTTVYDARVVFPYASLPSVLLPVHRSLLHSCMSCTVQRMIG